jgi:tetratricopeptide (TPR) repeat protein
MALLMSWGCSRKSSVKAPAPPASGTAPPKAAPPPAVTPPATVRQPVPLESTTLPKTITTPSNLELGERYFHMGKYSEAIKEYEPWLEKTPPNAKDRDLALFHVGLSYALDENSGRNVRRAEVTLKHLISGFPDSLYRDQAEFILGLLAQIEKLSADVNERDERIKKLSKELQVLKDIDLQRRPSRPND